ncbi:MAG: beta-ketoacyl synthase N-terminal-like domain-containing protein, partial [Planctomycetota bacterium]|nr:beta-ketoacyl synthase N-terminal-like domain-containing protein [Planctomycetota bacterium]
MSLENDKTIPLAIIGIGCMFPGAEDSTRYWSNIKAGRDGISDIPESHWEVKDYFDKDPKRPDFTYAKTGGFLKPFEFNPLDYGIPPNAIEATDTAQLLGLVTAQQALIDAGYDPKNDWDKSRVSVVLGVTGALELVIPLGARLGHPKWRRALEEAGVDTETANDVIERISDSYVGWQEASFPGLLGNVVAGRIANRLDLGGTNCVVDAACASSLSALHLASLELISGRSSMAIAGGVDTFNDIFMYMCFSKTPALSPTGHSRPFDAQGDGTILGEGVGMVVLKRLDDAKRDGDRIYSVLRGVGSSSDGKGQAIYAPSSAGQARALQNAYDVAGVSPDTVELVEAHGTGTKVGDDVELTALTQVYSAESAGKNGRGPRWCAIGSVKSQIGHTKAAAGVAGLIKASLALHHKVLPPSIKVAAPLPALANDSSPFYLNTLPRPWIGSEKHPRRAALSALGFGGSNFHCVLEESDSRNSHIDWTGDSQILAFSGTSRDAVSAALADFPKKATLAELRLLAAASRKRFQSADPIRVLLPLQYSETAVETVLAKGLALLGSSKGEGLHSTPDGLVLADRVESGEVAVLFPGQGSQYLGMLRDLACQFPAMLDVLIEAESVFAEGSHNDGLSDLIYPRWTFTNKETKAQQVAALTDTAVAQPAIGAASLGAYRILQQFGLKASLFAGHSYGELTALCAGQRIGSKDFHGLSRARGELMAAGDGDRGSMLAVKADVKTVEAFLKESKLNLVLANKNSPNQCVLSGASADVKKAVAQLKNQKLRCTELTVAAAFHSSFVSDAAKPLAKALDNVEFSEGVGTVFANTNGAPYPGDAKTSKDLLANQLAKPVEFVREIQAMYEAGARTFIEVGPGNRLTGLAKSILGDQAHFARALDSSGGRHHGVLDLARTISWLAALGLDIDLNQWDDGATLLAQAPKAKKKALMTVVLTGSNYRSPTKKKAPRAPIVKTQAPSTPQPLAAPRPAAKVMSSTNGQARRATAAAPLRQNKTVTPRKQEVTAMTIPSANPNQLSEALRITQENIAALQRIQEQNAQLHERFMEGQENAQQTFHLLFQQQQQLLLGTLGQGAPNLSFPPMTQTVPAPMQSSPPRVAPRRNGTSAPKPAPVAPRAQTQPKPTPVAPKASPAPAKQANTGISQTKISALLLAVVSEKTGYPAEMLE